MVNHTSSVKNLSFYSDGLKINAWLHMPEAKDSDSKFPAVIGSHGFLSDGSSAKMVSLGNLLSEMGIAFLRLDHRGCGQSEGHFAEVTSLAGRSSDVVSAVGILRTHPRINGRFGIFGSSMGGSTAIYSFAKAGARAIVTLAAPVRGSSIIRRPGDPNPHNLTEDFYETGLKFDISEEIKKLRNCLVFHGESDEIVPCANAYEIMDMAGEPKKINIFPDGDHRITDPRQQKTLVEDTAEWFRRHL